MASVSGRTYPRRTRTTTGTTVQEGRMISKVADGNEVVERDGMLCCTCPIFNKENWCTHVQVIVTDSKDASPSGAIHADFVMLPTTLIVPLFPSKQFFTFATLGALESDGSRKVTFRNGENDYVLGWIFPGEARNAIRAMIIEWLRAQYHVVPACKSSVHKRMEWSAADKREDDLKTREATDLWCLVTFGECAQCHRFTNFDSDAPEL